MLVPVDVLVGVGLEVAVAVVVAVLVEVLVAVAVAVALDVAVGVSVAPPRVMVTTNPLAVAESTETAIPLAGSEKESPTR